MRRCVLFLCAVVAASGQSASFPSSVVTDNQLRVAANNVQTTLSFPMLSSDTSASVVNATGIAANSIATIDNEKVAICNVVGNVLSIGKSSCPNVDGRGFDSTSAAGHASGAQVSLNIDAWHHNAMKAEVEAIESALGANLVNAAGTFTRPETGAVSRPVASGSTAKLRDVITAEDFGAAGDGTTDDTAKIQAALTAVQGTGRTLLLSNTYKVTGCPTATGPVVIGGGGTISVATPNGVAGCGIAITGTGPTGAQTTVTVNLPLASRSTSVTSTISVASIPAGFVAGAVVNLGYDDGTYHFEQNNVIQSISGLNITFVDPVVVPLITTQANNVKLMSMVARSVVKDLTFDCSGAGATPSSIYAQELYYAVNSTLDNISYKNCTSGGTDSAAGLYAYEGWRNTFRRLHTYGSGSLLSNAINLSQQSHPDGDDLDASNGPAQLGLGAGHGAFGIGFNYVILGSFCNITATGNYSRQIKLLGSGYNTFCNVLAADSIHATGLSITIGSYQNQFTNVVALNNHSDVGNGTGIWFEGNDNEYNVITNAISMGNDNDLQFASNGSNNAVLNSFIGQATATGSQVTTGSGTFNNRVTFSAGAQVQTSLLCTGTPNAAATNYMSFYPPGSCNNGNTVSTKLVVNSPGVLRNLRVTAGTGGVSGADGVVSLIINGTAGYGFCTLGTGISCTDTNLVGYRVNAGDVIQVAVTTQAATTLANINVSFEY
jgi:hypothetical protein